MKYLLDLANAQIIGFVEGVCYGKIVPLVTAMGLTEGEWNKWKTRYPNILKSRLRGRYSEEVDEYFARRRNKVKG